MLTPQLGDAIPRRGNSFSRWLGRCIFALIGWKIVGEFPNLKKFVIIAAPHSSNWDFIVAVGVILSTGIKISYLAKQSLFRPPFGFLFYWLGGIPTQRNGTQGLVGQCVAAMQTKEQLVFAIAPEGTRTKNKPWKHGFYYIAQGAGVPVLSAIIDNSRKQIVFSKLFTLSTDFESDMVKFKAEFEGYPDRHS